MDFTTTLPARSRKNRNHREPVLLCAKGINALSASCSAVNPWGTVSERTNCLRRIGALKNPDLSRGGMGQNASSASRPHPRQSRSEVIRVNTARVSTACVPQVAKILNDEFCKEVVAQPQMGNSKVSSSRVPSFCRASQQKACAIAEDSTANAVELGLTCFHKQNLAASATAGWHAGATVKHARIFPTCKPFVVWFFAASWIFLIFYFLQALHLQMHSCLFFNAWIGSRSMGCERWIRSQKRLDELVALFTRGSRWFSTSAGTSNWKLARTCAGQFFSNLMMFFSQWQRMNVKCKLSLGMQG